MKKSKLQFKVSKFYHFALSFSILIFTFFIFSEAHAAVLLKAPSNLGLVGYWSFNEGTTTTALDYSGNKNKGTLVNGPVWVNGKMGKALSFDGSDDLVVATNSPSLNFSGNITMAAWVYPKISNDYQTIIAKAAVSNFRQYAYYLSINGTSQIYVAINGVGGNIVVNPGWSTNKWNHIVVTANGVRRKIYINAILASDESSTAVPNPSSGGVFIGRDLPNNDFEMKGLIDDVRVYNRALSAAEVAALYNSGAVKHTNPNNLGLVGYWNFNEGTTTTALDYSGNKNKGTLVNGPVWVNGKMGKALDFDGSNDFVDVANPTTLQINTGTVVAWIKTANAGTSYRGIVAKQNAYGMFLLDNVFAIYDWGAAASRSTGVNLADNSWHFVAFSFRSGVTDGTVLYIDGMPRLTTIMTVSGQSTGLQIGWANSLNQQFDGLIDDVRIYNRVLSAAEVAALYNSGAVKHTNPNNLGLVGYWSFNEGTTTTALDYSGNKNKGTLVNGPVWVNGKMGKALSFDGVNDYVDAGSAASLDNVVPITISAWIKPITNGTVGAGRIVSKNTGSNSASDFMMHSSNALQFNARPSRITSANSIIRNVWQHVAVTWNGSNIAATDVKIYINGVEASYQTSTNGSGSPLDDSANNLLIGSTSGVSRNFDGLIDEVRIYNRVLSAAEVSALYNSR